MRISSAIGRNVLLGLMVAAVALLPVPPSANAAPSPAFHEEADDAGFDWARIISDSAQLLAAPSHRSRSVRETDLFELLLIVDRVKSFYLVRDEQTQSFLFIDQFAVEFVDYEPPKRQGTYLRDEKMRLGTTHPDLQLFGSQWSSSKRGSGKEAAYDGYCGGKWYPTSYSENASYEPKLDGHKLIRDAQAYTGTRYVYGGNSQKGIDCSGLTSAVARKQGVSLPRRASLQAQKGRMVSRSELQPGDLVFFRDYRDPGYLSHVGVYLTGGRFIHASSKLRKVAVSSLSEKYYSEHFAFGRRL
ncbi:C40 family peptidase [bacterium]|nr:C40 family peptidase [bacterium]